MYKLTPEELKQYAEATGFTEDKLQALAGKYCTDAYDWHDYIGVVINEIYHKSTKEHPINLPNIKPSVIGACGQRSNE
jgi:menaquinone-dependent protoporphyrinogen IX oxidase